ncbi:MAG: DNA primase [Kiritimatiellae bacterium]|nr:DNA primase [Kiritimatiellia bacterium]
MSQGITEATIEEIKLRTDLAELISSYGVDVRHAGSSLKACCPFHNEKTPSFHINQSKGFYHCFGCGESGDAIKFVQKMEGLSFVEAVKKLAPRCGIEITERSDPDAGRRKRLYALMAELAQFYHRCLLKTKEAALARDYLAKRNLGEEVQKEFLIGYAPNGMATMSKWAEKYGFTLEELEAAGVIKRPERAGDNGYHRFGARLMFTICDRQGRTVAFSGRQLIESKRSGKYVNSPETLIFKKANVLFGFDKASGFIAKKREVILCEGQIDVIRLHMSGFKTAVASQGTAFTVEHAKQIKRVADSAVLMYDDDKAGRKATVATAQKLLELDMPVKVVSLPGGADPDSFLSQNKPEALQALIDGAESIVSFQCRTAMAEETAPFSVASISRVSNEILKTISLSSSAILRAAFVDETARILSLPVAALSEELQKIKLEPRKEYVQEPIDEDVWEEAFDGEEAEDRFLSGEGMNARIAPPPEREFALMEFLMANERATEIESAIAELLPEFVFENDFTKRFVRVWRDEIANSGDMFADFAASLSDFEKGWFDRTLLNAGRVEASSLEAVDIFNDFVRLLWVDYLKRARDAMPFEGNPDDDVKRMRLSMNIKHLMHLDWEGARRLILELKGA